MSRQILVVFITVLFSITLSAQNRVERPFQAQLNLSGLFLRASGTTLSNRDVIDLEVNDYETPGLIAGYHLNRWLYLGYAYHPNRNVTFRDTYSFDVNNLQDDVLITVDHNTGTFHTVEGRFSPFKFGLYGSFFFTHVTEASYDMTAEPQTLAYLIDGTIYASVLNMEWNFKELTTMGIGLGYNHVTSMGLSFNIGFGVPIDFSGETYDDFNSLNDDGEFDQDDLITVSEILQDDSFYFPIHFYFGLGWNFGSKTNPEAP